MIINSNPQVLEVISKYPKKAKERLTELQLLVFEVAEENGVKEIEETLKWGEPSYISKHGSTIRMD